MLTDCLPELNSADGLLRASVSLQGGFCRSLMFMPSPASLHHIFHRAPWLDGEPLPASEPPLMSSLGGEWVGVPFGHTDTDDGLFFANSPHGLPANQRWQLIEQKSDELTLRYVFPSDYPIAELQRSIRLERQGRACFSLTIIARSDCRMPVGLHPVFPFGGAFGPLEIKAKDERGIVYPQAVEENVSQLKPGYEFTSLQRVERIDGSYADVSCQPLGYMTEEIVQLLKPGGSIGLSWPQRNLSVQFSWDETVLPSCLLWMSNGGRSYAPWNSQNFCLGVEAIHSAWDLGPKTLQGDTAIDKQGVSTALSLKANQPLHFAYSFLCEQKLFTD